jgi:hypothetical protein
VAHERYDKAAKILADIDCHMMLDVGSGGVTPQSGFTIAVDIKRKHGVHVIADASYLPFADSIFECVTAIDVIEHIAPQKRKNALEEMKRVGNTVLIHAPIQDNKLFMGKTGDVLFFDYMKKSLNIVDENTLQHLECGQPSLTELTEHGFNIIQPDWNLNVWLTLMKYRNLPYNFSAPVMTVIYFLFLRKIKNAPFWGAYLIYCNNSKATLRDDMK